MPQNPERELSHAKEALKRIKKENKELHRLLNMEEDEKSAAIEIANDTRTFKIKSSVPRGSNEATAVMIASDWHVAERVKSFTVSGLNRFDERVARARAERFFRNGLRITQVLAKDINIKNMVLGFLGDFISGNIHEELLENCSLPPVEEALFAQELLASGIEFLLANSNFPLTIICAPGNHSRITSQVHVSTEAGNSLETFIYHALRKRYEGKRVKFIITGGYHTYLQVYDLTLRFHHGHAIKYGGGIGGLFIPAFKAISQWNKARWADVDFFG